LNYTYKEITSQNLTRELNTNGSVSIELTFRQSKACIAFFKEIDDENNISRVHMIYMIVKAVLAAILSPKLFDVVGFYSLEQQPSYFISKENGKAIITFRKEGKVRGLDGT